MLEVDPFERKSPPAQESSAPAKNPSFTAEIKPKVTVIEGDGTESSDTFDVVTLNEKNIVIKRVMPDMKKIKVSGVELEVDLNALKRMSPNATLHGKPVELLIAAATLA